MQALKASSEEFSRILDIMGRYAAYKAGVAFSCKRQVNGASWRQCAFRPWLLT